MLRLWPTWRCSASRTAFFSTARRESVTKLPRGMTRFQHPPSTPASVASAPPSSSSSSASPSSSVAVPLRVPHDGASPLYRVPAAAPLQGQPQLVRFLPPWPVDVIEFNALSVDGGHGDRKTWLAASRQGQRDSTSYDSSDGGGGEEEGEEEGAMCLVPKKMPLTTVVLRRLAEEEGGAEAQAALAVGGWVCTGCWSVVHGDSDTAGVTTPKRNSSSSSGDGSAPGKAVLFPRTVCPTCRTLRHDVQTWTFLTALRASEAAWTCADCGEVNHDAQQPPSNQKSNARGGDRVWHPQQQFPRVCRCCGACQEEPHASSRRPSPRQSMADEVASGELGHIVVTRNRTTRWRCGSCGEINSLQMAHCRNCAQERFALTVCCPQCAAPRVLSNALVYATSEDRSEGPTRGSAGSDDAVAPWQDAGARATRGGVTSPRFPVFALSNCFHPRSTQLDCLQCGSPLHGGYVSSFRHGATPWWCACGVTNSPRAYSCFRCRLPRSVPNTALLKQLIHGAAHRHDDRDGNRADEENEAGVRPRRSAMALAYDFATCTTWFCNSCEGINRAPYQIITQDGPPGGFRDRGAPHHHHHHQQRRRQWVEDGCVHCRHCAAPWHHQLLQDGQWWRCACHALNQRSDAVCASCGLPAADDLQPATLASWTFGDWRCEVCGTHCYRDRLQCRCGASRPSTAAVMER